MSEKARTERPRLWGLGSKEDERIACEMSTADPSTAVRIMGFIPLLQRHHQPGFLVSFVNEFAISRFPFPVTQTSQHQHHDDSVQFENKIEMIVSQMLVDLR